MSGLKNFRPLLRAAIVLGSVGTITTAATFAALQSQQAVLASNTINSATASLSVSTDNTSFSNSKTGFTFSGVVPGGASVPTGGNPVWLRNSGSANLSLKAAISSTPSNLSNVDLNKVFLHVTRSDNSFDQSFSLKSLIDGYATGGVSTGDTINISATVQYLLRVSMTSDAFSGSSGVTISGVDLVFTGTGL
jgi:hypothetical protein